MKKRKWNSCFGSQRTRDFMIGKYLEFLQGTYLSRWRAPCLKPLCHTGCWLRTHNGRSGTGQQGTTWRRWRSRTRNSARSSRLQTPYGGAHGPLGQCARGSWLSTRHPPSAGRLGWLWWTCSWVGLSEKQICLTSQIIKTNSDDLFLLLIDLICRKTMQSHIPLIIKFHLSH